jgi:pyruvate-ferredoxin/flavodoxin oxidoreductase
VAPEDCTGCGACVNACPTRPLTSLEMVSQKPLLPAEKENWLYFLSLPETEEKLADTKTMLGSQLRRPLFEFNGACAGCGETPYIRLLTQIYGDRLLIANASGCSSVYGGYMPTVPYTKRSDGRGPAWSNSLFEDNAEFGLGMRLSTDKLMQTARGLLSQFKGNGELVKKILGNEQRDGKAIAEQRAAVGKLKETLKDNADDLSKRLLALADALVYKSVWAIGGDGWAYDIGYGGLDHVLASGENINLLVMDTEVYSNTGGQSSKATPKGAIAKFAAAGKSFLKKPLGLMQSLYGYVYVAQVNMGANIQHVLSAFHEAESFPGPSLIIAYSHCISHGIDMSCGMEESKKAVECGMWPLFRYNPLRKAEGKNPFVLDSKAPKLEVLEDYLYSQVRFKSLKVADPKRAEFLLNQLKTDIMQQYKELEYMAVRSF